MTWHFETHWCWDCPWTSVLRKKAQDHKTETGHRVMSRVTATKSFDF